MLDEELEVFGFELLGPAADQHVGDITGGHMRLQGPAADIQKPCGLGHGHEQRPVLFLVAVLRFRLGVHSSSVSHTCPDANCFRLLKAGSALSIAGSATRTAFRRWADQSDSAHRCKKGVPPAAKNLAASP